MIKKRGFDEIEFRSAPNRIIGEVFSGKAFDALEVTVRVVDLESASVQGPRRPHWHEGFEEVIHCARGSGRIWADNQWTNVSAGDTILIPPGVVHATFNLSDEPMRLICFFPRPDIDPVSFADEYISLNTTQDGSERERGE